MSIIVTVKSPVEQSSEDNMIIFRGAIYHSTIQIDELLNACGNKATNLEGLGRVTETQNAINLGISE